MPSAPQMVDTNRWVAQHPYTNLQGEVVWVEIMENTEYFHYPGFCGYNNDVLDVLGRLEKQPKNGEKEPRVVSPNVHDVQVLPAPSNNPQWCLPEFRSSSQGPPAGGPMEKGGDRGDPPPSGTSANENPPLISFISDTGPAAEEGRSSPPPPHCICRRASPGQCNR